MNIVRTRVSMPSEATLLFCHGWKWAYQVCGLPVRISCGLQAHFWCVPSLEQGGGKFPNWGLFSITFGCLLLMMLRMIFKRGSSGNFSPCHGCCQSPRSYLIWGVLKKLKLCSFQAYLGWSNCYPTVKPHINFQLQKPRPRTQLLPPKETQPDPGASHCWGPVACTNHLHHRDSSWRCFGETLQVSIKYVIYIYIYKYYVTYIYI